jgi:(2Fe-2S) ferredoxin
MNRKNIMGSEVVDGFACKPKRLDPNRPIMHYKTHIFVCQGDRCKKTYKQDDIAKYLREIIKELKLDRGEKRIKVSRSGCFGACRFRAVINIYENSRADGFLPNDNLWIKRTHQFNIEKWIEIFKSLASNRKLEDILGEDEFIPMKVYH